MLNVQPMWGISQKIHRYVLQLWVHGENKTPKSLLSKNPFPLSTSEKGSLAAKRNVKWRYENDDHG